MILTWDSPFKLRLRWMCSLMGTTSYIIPSKREKFTNAGLMFGPRPRRWANINPALGELLVFAE